MVVVDEVVVVVELVVVVDTGWHTEMLTVLPPATGALAGGVLTVHVAGLGPVRTSGVEAGVRHEAEAR